MLVAGEMIATNKPWEVIVGQTFATCEPSVDPHSLATYLGGKATSHLLGH